MRNWRRLIVIAFITLGLSAAVGLSLWRVKINYAVRSTPLPQLLAQMLFDRSFFLPNWSDIRDEVEITLFEGLPHQKYEYKSLELQLKTKPTIQIAKYPFYREPLEFHATHADSVMRILLSSFYLKYNDLSAVKSCGGFHPDYAIRLSTGDAQFDLLICLGCGEVKIITPDETKLFDMSGRAEQLLKQQLHEYRKNRPPYHLDIE